MPRTAFEVAGIFRAHGARYRQQHGLPFHQLRLMHAIESCRTATLGGHREKCSHCPEERISYNSCCNRHCPKCQNLARTKWVDSRKGELLPIEYHRRRSPPPRRADRLLLGAAQLGTKSAVSSSHSLCRYRRRHQSRRNPVGFLQTRILPARPCAVAPFRRLFLEALQDAFQKDLLRFPGIIASLREPAAFLQLTSSLRQMEWVVYSEPPFGGPQRVLEYLGRYTHRVALENRRILNVHDGNVTFQYKQYRSADAARAAHPPLRPVRRPH